MPTHPSAQKPAGLARTGRLEGLSGEVFRAGLALPVNEHQRWFVCQPGLLMGLAELMGAA